jgi:hypothetical protein
MKLKTMYVTFIVCGMSLFASSKECAECAGNLTHGAVKKEKPAKIKPPVTSEEDLLDPSPFTMLLLKL